MLSEENPRERIKVDYEMLSLTIEDCAEIPAFSEESFLEHRAHLRIS